MADTSEPTKSTSTRRSKRKCVSKVKETQSAEAAAEDDDKQKDSSPKGESSPTRSTDSPDPNCAICLSKLENKSFTDSCFHMFCFVCLLEWSKIKAECPLCKQPFKSIIHNVRSYEDYDQYHVERPENQFSYDPSSNDRRFRYRTTMTQGFRPRRYSHLSDPVASILSAPTTLTTRQHWRRHRQAATSEFRRRVYINGLRVAGIQDSNGRCRNVSPEFFSSNPATTHRLVPWLNRELNALLYNHEEHVQFVLELIMGLIKRFPIQSEEFYQHVYPYIGRHTRHFMHELEMFAKSPYCIIQYDQKAMYEQQPEFVSDSDSNSGNDSDVIIVSPSSEAETRQRRDPGAIRRQNVRTEITPVALSLQDLLEEDETVTANSGWDSPIAGPSWHLNSDPIFPARSFLEPGPSSLSLQSNRQKSFNEVRDRSTKQDTISNSLEVVSDSGSEVLCVGYEKPWQERTPVLVSTDSEEEKVMTQLKKNQKTEKKEKKKRRRHHSRSRSSSRSPNRRSRSSSRYTSCQSPNSISSSKSHRKHKSSSRKQRSRSGSRHRRRKSPSPRSKNRERKRNRSITYEDAFGHSRITASPERHKKKKRSHHQSSHFSDSSKSRSPSSRHRKDRYYISLGSRDKRHSRSSSVELMSSRHKQKKHKKHKKNKDKDRQSRRENVNFKIVKDKDNQKKNKDGDPMLSITIKRDKADETSIVSSTVDNSNADMTPIDMPDDVVARSEPPVTQQNSPNNRQGHPSSGNSEDSTSPKQSKSTEHSKDDSDVSFSSVEERRRRRKSFKKHPSGHKKSRRPLPRLPDPASTVTSSTSVQQSESRMPVLDAISQLFNGFSGPGLTSTQISDGDIPGMWASLFGSQPSPLFGSSMPFLSDFLPRSIPPPPVTSSENPLVLSSSDESDVVVTECVKTGNKVSSSTSSALSSGLAYNIMDRIPVISDDIDSHKSVEVEETIDVEELDNISPAKQSVLEVIDSDDDDKTETFDSSLDSKEPGQDKGNTQSSTTDPSCSTSCVTKVTSSRLDAKKDDHGESDSCSDDIIDVGGNDVQVDPNTSGATDNQTFNEVIDVGGNDLHLVQGRSNATSATDDKQLDEVIDVGGTDIQMPGATSNISDATNDRKGDEVIEVGGNDIEVLPATSNVCEASDDSTINDIIDVGENEIPVTTELNNVRKFKMFEQLLTDEESMDIDVTGVEEESASQKKSSSTANFHKGGTSEESMDIDVVGEEEETTPVEASCDGTPARVEEDHNVSQNVSNMSRPDGAESVTTDAEEPCVPSTSEHLGDDLQSKHTKETLKNRLEYEARHVSDSSTKDLSSLIHPKSESFGDVTKDSLCRDAKIPKDDQKSSKSDECGAIQTPKDDQTSSDRTTSEGDESDAIQTRKVPVVEGASEISSEEESLIQIGHSGIQMEQQKSLKDSRQIVVAASDISSEEEDYDDCTVTASCTKSRIEKSKKENDKSRDEGEISEESKDSESWSDDKDSVRYVAGQSNHGRQRHDSELVHCADNFLESKKREYAVESQSEVNVSNFGDDSCSSGELSDDSEDSQVYDDISSPEDFDSPRKHEDEQFSLKIAKSSNDKQDSLSEGEIISD